MPNFEKWDKIKKNGIRSLSKWINSYEIDPALKSDNALIRTTLHTLAEQASGHLYNPFTSTLFTNNSSSRKTKIIQDASLIIYLHQLKQLPLQNIHIPFCFRTFLSGSTIKIEEGTLELNQLDVILPPPSNQPSLDICNYTLGQSNTQTWISRTDLNSKKAENELNGVCESYSELITILNKYDNWTKWVNNITSVIIPLYSPDKGYVSGSFKNTLSSIGMEFSTSTTYNFKILVHESAHLYFHTAEFFEDLVVPNHTKEYWSPVKLCPRPLRMVLLAYHALVFMGLLLNELNPSHQKYIEELKEYKKRIIKSKDILEKTRPYLTDNGKFILDLTSKEAEPLL